MIRKYLIILFLSLIFYILYKLIKKDFFKNKIKTLKEILVILTGISYIYVLLSPRAKFLYDMSFIKAIIIMLSLSCFYFAYGLIENKERTYNRNIIRYVILYLILLISITIIIGRPDIDFKNLRNFSPDNLIPFKSIYRYLTYDVLLRKQLYNLVGNLIMLIPLSFLLMLKDKKYDKLLNQVKIILPSILCIEILQSFTLTGAFDIDDIILNFSGAMLFSFLITRFNFISNIRKIFYSDFNLKKSIKYGLLFVSMILPTIFVIDTLRISIDFVISYYLKNLY